MKPIKLRTFDIVAVLALALVVLLSVTAAGAPTVSPATQPPAPTLPLEPAPVLPATVLPATVLPAPASPQTAMPAPALPRLAGTPATAALPATVAPSGHPATLEAAALPVPAAEMGMGCSAGEGEALYTDAQSTYCFVYPAELSLTGSDARTVSLVGPPLSQGPESSFVSLGIEVSEAIAPTLSASVAEALAQLDGFTAWEIQSTDTTLGGEAAVRVEPVPGQLISRVLYAQRDGKRYRLSFWPADPNNAVPELESLYSTVTRSFRFLDPAAPGAGATPEPAAGREGGGGQRGVGGG